MSKTIYIVTEGEYSDTRMMAAFTSLAHAEQFKAYCDQSDSPEIEELTLDPEQLEPPPGLRPYSLTMRRDGSSRSDASLCRSPAEVLADGPTYGPPQLGVKTPDGRLIRSWAYFRVWARDEQHAIKSANEKRVQWIADGTWPPDP